MKKIAILGSTGSIGTQALEVIDALGGWEVVALSAHKNIRLLSEQIKKYKPKYVAVTDPKSAGEIKGAVCGITDEILGEADFALNAIVGNAGLLPTLKAIELKKDVGLANKETLVTAGEIVMERARANNVAIIPIDSEHSAIFQCLRDGNKISKILLTASGGPFRTWPSDKIKTATPQDALKHPNWNMGAKITIDSASLMNKGLEFIEARRLFNTTNIEIVVHPESVVHSAVEFDDGSVIAQLGAPDMRLPIAYALTNPKRANLPFKKLNIFDYEKLTFERPRYDDFPCLNLAKEALKMGGVYPAILNAANETAVELFLRGEILFGKIPELIETALFAYNLDNGPMFENMIENVLSADNWARKKILSLL
jgi:1-deoxy-D-xylulose-5-phosphate reductoisomerase